jgi:DNA repair exonuclease SbcCD ATPase subunit
MKLEKLIVKNLGPYREKHEFDLSGELTIFYGANFSGKSTLAKAVYFALTGKALSTGIKPPALASANTASGTGVCFIGTNKKAFGFTAPPKVICKSSKPTV